VDGAPRVACVTPLRRVAGRSVTTADGLSPEVVDPLVERFGAAGAAQCGFCTPGIIVRCAALGPAPSPDQVHTALLAHLCRCTGWRTIVDTVAGPSPSRPAPAADRDLAAAARRAAIEGGVAQAVGPDAVLGRARFAADTAPDGSLVAVPDGRGGWQVAATVAQARAAVGKVQGRRSGQAIRHPLELPPGDWALTLRTTWVEPAYLEPDASWCEPGGTPASPVANGGAFGGKTDSIVSAAARRLADEHGRPVLAVLSREDVVRLGPKRPPIAAGVRADGTGVLRAVATPGLAEIVAAAAPGLTLEEVDVAGPPTSVALRAAGWAEAAVLAAAASSGASPGACPGAATATVTGPSGAVATATVEVDGAGAPRGVEVTVSCGDPLDEVVLRSYLVGAAHMALGWVTSEAIAVDADGRPEDLTIRSFGVLRARDTPPVTATIQPGDGPAVNGSDAAFAAVAAATWIAQGLPPAWPTRRGSFR
jgi:xanthine dehydrogenase small subunit